ncbi:IS110 family transposase [Patescibacteria group bacterium]|nr:IS110 family transposase [Patescibacteria group bacterium]
MPEEKVFYLGVDVGKYHHQATLIDNQKVMIGQSFRFENNLASFENLTQTIKKQLPSEAIVKVGMESTGHYYWQLKNYLLENGFNYLQVINPIETQELSKIRIRKVKNDRIDSLAIAQIISQKNIQSCQENPELNQLKNLTRFAEKLKSQKRFYQQELTVLLERICPEFFANFSRISLPTPLAIIKGYFLENMNSEQLIAKAIKTSRGRLKEDKAQKIIKDLNNSIDAYYRHENINLQLKMILSSMELIKDQIEEIKTQIEKTGKDFKEIEYLSSIKGVSNYLASVILSEIGDINRFERKEQLTAFAGLDASVKESGQYHRKQGNHISKRGSKYLRRQLYYVAKTAIMHDPELKKYYEKKKSEGKHYNVTIIAVARKILMRCYAVLKQKRLYEVRVS